MKSVKEQLSDTSNLKYKDLKLEDIEKAIGDLFYNRVHDGRQAKVYVIGTEEEIKKTFRQIQKMIKKSVAESNPLRSGENDKTDGI